MTAPTKTKILPPHYRGDIHDGYINCCIDLYSVKVSGCFANTCFAYDRKKNLYMFKCPHFKNISNKGVLPCYKKHKGRLK